ncbi:HDOD domain-containing protein [Pseudomonas sp. 5P_3.1_Bac2]|uniref:HDOD domain-containing protein n=1 Tax=Pseudomonas sp. 5P_3.1_Bac2 TaxID=2971617 RepID=UPI0021C9F7CF|nr:HDOD domain-containing protein [Pseudomonas sp. 5P_3.1_Bac2]MCU1718302.1 HDOD domain-containing protein [Pseudomonas sp. 5P_3.1_Bac2]
MSKPAIQSRTLQDWLKQLDSPLLPATNSSVQAMREAFADSTRSIRELADLIQECPALALSVLREANRPGTVELEQAESLEAAISRLGIARCETLLKRLPAVDEAQIAQALRQIQLISQHASRQANGLFGARLARLWHEIHWGSLLFLAPVWALLAAHPELLETWQQRVLLKREAAHKVERELLGVPLLQLCLALSEHWHLPLWVSQSWRLLLKDRRLLVKALRIARDNEHPLQQQHCLDDDKQLQRWLTQPANSLLLANALAITAHHAWDSRHNLRWQMLTGLICQIPREQVQQQLHHNAVSSAQQHARPGLWHPAQALLWPDWRVSHIRAERPAEVDRLAQWRQHCRQLLAQPSAFTNVLQLTHCANQALASAGMQRVLLLLTDRQHSRLQAQQQTGLDKVALTLTLYPQQSELLRRLLSAPRQLRISPSNMAQFSALLPGSLKGLFPSEHLLLRSLASNNHVVMLLVADFAGHSFSDTQIEQFSKTCQCIERALSSFAQRQR